MELSQYLIPLNIETINFLDMGLLNFVDFSLMPFPNIVDLPFFGEFPEGLYLPLAALGFNILPGILVLLLLHDELVTLNISIDGTWFSRVC